MARVTVSAEAVAKATITFKGVQEPLEVEVGAGAAAKGFVESCLPGGFICGKVGGSLGPQIGLKAKVTLWPPHATVAARVGLVGLEFDVRLNPDALVSYDDVQKGFRSWAAAAGAGGGPVTDHPARWW